MALDANDGVIPALTLSAVVIDDEKIRYPVDVPELHPMPKCVIVPEPAVHAANVMVLVLNAMPALTVHEVEDRRDRPTRR